MPDIARKKARELLLAMSSGINPSDEKRKAQLKGKTLRDIHRDYLSQRGMHLAKATRTNYEDFLRLHMSDWAKLPMRDISREMVLERYQRLTSYSGKYAANHTLKFLGTLFAYAQIDDEDLKNPVQAISMKKLWHPKLRRTTLIKDSELKRLERRSPKSRKSKY